MAKDFTHIIGFKRRYNYIFLIEALYRLSKLPLSLHISISALMGYVLVNGKIDSKGLFVFFSILLLACGGAVLNNLQDKEYDKLFTRTKDRLIPNGVVSEKSAVFIASFFIISGLLILFYLSKSYYILTLGATSIILYNFIYTALKKISSLGVIPGALCGMLPPLIGWLSAGGNFYDIKIIYIMLVFGIWQFPHYFMVLLQNRKDFESHKTVINYYPEKMFKAVVAIWVLNYFSIISTLPLVGILNSKSGNIFLLFCLFIILPFVIYNLIKQNYKFSFIGLNCSLLIFMFFVMIESVHKGV